jgi:hypothetical protein
MVHQPRQNPIAETLPLKKEFELFASAFLNRQPLQTGALPIAKN